EARYTEDSLRALFKAPFDGVSAQLVRQVMRQIVLTNYVRKEELADVGWCYWTQRVRNQWEESAKTSISAFRDSTQSLIVDEVQELPFTRLTLPKPSRIVLPAHFRDLLDTLYQIEDRFVAGCRALSALIQSHAQKSPHDFEEALGQIGAALTAFDRLDEGDNTVFAVLDQLVRLETPPSQARASSLTLISKLPNNEELNKRFIAQPEGLELVG
ncbi:MAG TPA: hypothetical protein VFZ34_11525, partial [Blastocatellia bacterium]|nr:hypothetical protein [Blastocatellia bacterium]